VFVDPITSLAGAARKIASGELSARAHTRRGDEIGELAEAFNSMADEVASTVGSLERRVAHRTAQLAAERERLSVTINSIGDGVIAVDTEGSVTLMNGVAQSLTGYSQRDALGLPLRRVFTIINQETRQPAADPVAQVLRKGQVGELADHTLLIAHDGTEHSIADSAAPIRGADGDILGVVLVFRDVTEERRTQSQLRQLAMIAQQAGEGIAVADLDGTLTFVNAAWADMHGYDAEELIGKHLSMFHTEKQIGADVIPFNDRVKLRGYHTGEVGHVRKDGTPFPTQMTTTLFRDERDQPVGLIGFAADITERRRAQEQLQDSERKYRELVTTSLDGVVSTDPQMRITVWNSGAERIFGYTQGEMLGRSLMKVIPERYREPKQKGFAAFGESGSGPVIGQIVQVEGLRKDGTEVPLELSVSSRMVDGAHIATAIVRDITERVRSEAIRAEAEEALRRRTAQLAALREVGLEITGQLDLNAVLHSIVSRATELLGATMGGLYLYGPQLDVLEGTTWVSQHAVPADLVLRRGEGLSIVDDYCQWEGRPPVWEGYPAVSVLGVPVRWGPEGEEGEFLGVLDVAADTPHAFSTADADLLSLFASQAAIAIHNARLYLAQQERAEELQAAYGRLQKTQEALVKTERLAAMSQIGVTVRHEINNPLTAVLGYAQWLLMSDLTLSSKSRELAAEIEKGALRIRDVVRRLDSRDTASLHTSTSSPALATSSLPSSLCTSDSRCTLSQIGVRSLPGGDTKKPSKPL
jgi:PAS domain S-box-containing protein